MRQSNDKPIPLSFAQERLWFLEQLEPGNAGYNICRASRLTGNLSVAALEASLGEIVRRHEVLRSAICVVDGRPAQVVGAAPKFLVSHIDLRALPDAGRDNEVQRRISEEAGRPFDFAAGLFLRAALLRLEDEEYILILTTHHMVSDAWSMGILTTELWALFEAYAQGKSSPLKHLRIQYADFAGWQREWLKGDVLDAQLSYWKKQLNEIPTLNLPTDQPRPARQSFHGARVPIALPQSLMAAINEMSSEVRVTPFMILLAVFQVLLYRYSGQEDVVVGSPIANRNRAETESLIGFFVNTLVLRGDLSGNPSFKGLLSRVRDVCLEAYAHQDLPFEKLVEELRPERDLSRNPLFQVIFAFQNTPRALPQVSGISVEPVEIQTVTSPFDLSLYLRERDGKFIGGFEFSTDLFDRSTIERMVGHFQRLLEAIVADPERHISDLPLLMEAERHQLLIEWNNTAADYPKDLCIHELFEAQVERTPDAVAIVFEHESLTYQELNRRANQLAHYLISLGVGPEKLVGLCIERSLEMVVGLLGILKAGGAYVPLDPAYPRERLAFMFNDSQISVLLTQEKLQTNHLKAISLQESFKAVWLERDWKKIARHSDENPTIEIAAENLAYVIYTSGSTGQPKGVAIEHRGAVNLLEWAGRIFRTEDLQGLLASTSICFDLSVFEIFVPLSFGGKVILAENALCLHDLPIKNGITLINTVPSLMAELIAMSELPESVRTINLAGEALRSELVERVYKNGRVETIYDLYGPSETTTYSTFALRTADGPTTIGRPIANTHIYILDGSLQPVPVGVPGEVYIGGVGVARGYLNRPEPTAERFIPSPFISDTNQRLYRTGDLARYKTDGKIEFLGRVDNQVKIRGYRIEAGEIESILNEHPAVQQSVVVFRDLSAEKTLVAYIVPRRQSANLVPDLRNFLKEKVPGYMIPSAFVILEALPLLPNSKVDRKKLPSPDDARPRLTEEFVRPWTEIEELIAQMWREVLKLENLGMHNDFFELGGHSLLAAQIVSRLRDIFNREVPLRVLFEAPTIASLAGKMESLIYEGHVPELPPIVPVPRDGPLPLSINQEHLWHLDQMMPGTHFFNIPYAYQLSGNVNIEALEKAISEIIRRHEALRTVFAEVDGKPVQVIQQILSFQLPVVDLRSLKGYQISEKAASLILQEREESFDLATGPLFRTKLLRLKNEEHMLLVTMHHIISDHWSMQVFRWELASLYEAFCQGCPSPLKDLSVQFADYAVWERQLLEDRLLQAQLDYWKKQLRRPLRQIGFKESGTRNELSFKTSHHSIEIDESLFAKLKQLAAREKFTSFMIIIAVLSIVLYQHTGQRDIRIGTLVANRYWKKSELAVGYLLNTVIIRVRVLANLTYRQLLRQVREVALEAYAHQQLPFESLAGELVERENIRRASLFQVLLTHDIATFRSLGLHGGLTLAPFNLKEIDTNRNVMISTYDLIFDIQETSTKLIGTVNYKDEISDQSAVASMMGSFRLFLESMVEDLNQRIVMKI
jgi:amino acid adenylation domain-containing protein